MPQPGTDTNALPGLPAPADTGPVFRFSDPARSFSADSLSIASPSPQVFSGHRLQHERVQPSLRPPGNPDWFIFALFVVIAYFTTLRVIYDRAVSQLLSAFTSQTFTSQAVRDENLLLQRTSVLLSVLFYLSGGLFLYQLVIHFGWEREQPQGFPLFFLFAVLLASVYATKLILLKVLGFVFRAGKLVSSYIFNVFLVNNVIGILLLPVVACIAFLPPMAKPFVIYTAIAVVCLCWLFRIVRGIRAWVSVPGYSVYYLILYLCAFEIAPVFVISKLV